jgi:hypothetical protein
MTLWDDVDPRSIQDILQDLKTMPVYYDLTPQRMIVSPKQYYWLKDWERVEKMKCRRRSAWRAMLIMRRSIKPWEGKRLIES